MSELTVRERNWLGDQGQAQIEAKYDALVARAEAAEREAKNLREALADLLNAVDAVCDGDSISPTADPMLPGHARTVLELAAQRARSVLAGEPQEVRP